MAKVLDLSTLAPDRATVAIKSSIHPDGKLYEIASFDDLSVTDQQFLYARGTAMQELMEKREPTDEDRQELEHIWDKMVQMCLPELEDEVRAEMKGGLKVKVIEAFIEASPEVKTRAEAVMKAGKQTSGS